MNLPELKERLAQSWTRSARELTRLWRVVAMYPPYEDYQRRTEREIPIFVP
jgi:F420H(2)-dependent quinone reductase